MMNLRRKKIMASSVLNCSPKRIAFDTARLEDISKAVTKNDIRKLIEERAIIHFQKKGISKYRMRKNKIQKRKGLQKGHGSRKGTKNARLPKKAAWMNSIRLQREFLKELKEKQMLEKRVYREIYLKCKGGYFRSKRHLKLYLNERNLIMARKKERVKEEIKQEKQEEENAGLESNSFESNRAVK